MTEPNKTQTQPTTETRSAPNEFARLIQKDFRPAGVFEDPDLFNHAQRVAKMLVTSSLAPEQFRGESNLGNAVIAVDVAFRLKLSPLLLMQQLNIIHGKPGFSAQFVIATINASGRFTRIQFKIDGQGDARGCVAYGKDLTSGETLESTRVDVAMAKKQGWWDKNGSKWPVMTDQMLVYRAAAFWGRAYAPELLMGLQTVEELEDTTPPEFSKPIFEAPPVQAPEPPKAVVEPPKAKEPKPKPTPKPAPEPAPLNPIQLMRHVIKQNEMNEADVLSYLHAIGASSESFETLEALALAQPEAFKTLDEQLVDFLNHIKNQPKGI